LGVGDGVPVGAGEALGAGVGLGLGLGLAVGGAVAGGFVGGLVGEVLGPEPDQTITSCGGCGPSRDESEMAVLFAVESPKLIVPLPATAEVTSTLVQVPAAILPELPSRVGPKGGEFALAIVLSPQVLSATE
jgi:hypothetical protein